MMMFLVGAAIGIFAEAVAAIVFIVLHMNE